MPEPSVLVVDDEVGIIRLCRRLLEKTGLRVMTASDPQEGIRILEEKLVDLVLVDIRMPGMDGFQLIERARKHQPDLAIVIMTGYGTVETAIEALRRGADSLILKPFSGIDLVESVRRALVENQQKQDALRLHTLRPLFSISEAFFTETNPHRLQELLLDAVCGSLRCSIAGLYLRGKDVGNYKLMSGRGHLPMEVAGEPGWDFLTHTERANALIRTTRQGSSETNVQSSLGQLGWEAILSTPFVVAGLIGVLFAARGIGEDIFSTADQEIFAILVRQAGIALENARLHNELRNYIRQVEESQRALIQAEKLAITGRLTASIAHEINNPLQAVQNCLHLAGRLELNDSSRQNYLMMAQNEMDRLMLTIQRMLEYYRPGAVDRKAVDINDLVKRVLSLTQKQLDDQRIKVTFKVGKSPIQVMVVSDQIQQVLLNIILNAMEAMPDGGELIINTAVDSGQAVILIEDNGPGVPPEYRARIFEPFVSTKEAGIGLGLAVSYGIISAHGGMLELVEGKGSGACFRITLSVDEGA